MKTIVVSGVNIRKGGTLKIMRECLSYLATKTEEYRVIALVHDRSLYRYDSIEYIELPYTTKTWLHRLWCEYVTMHGISRKLAPITLWLSLHDTTPRVEADVRAVYCQTSYPFYKAKWRDLRFDYKIVLFSLFTRFAYRVGIFNNRYLIVQQEWLRDGFTRMFHLPKEKFIVSPPKHDVAPPVPNINTAKPIFFYPATPDCHKNFETLCEAAKLLGDRRGHDLFEVRITIAGDENKYARWLYKQYSEVPSIKFTGFLSKEDLDTNYASCACLVFPSLIETWGLPISEFAAYGKPMLVSDLPYAHETTEGSLLTDFFTPTSVVELSKKMENVLVGNIKAFKEIDIQKKSSPYTNNWKELFNLLLK